MTNRLLGTLLALASTVAYAEPARLVRPAEIAAARDLETVTLPVARGGKLDL